MKLKRSLRRSGRLSFWGESEYLLNMHITRDKQNGTIAIDQRTMIKHMLEENGMEDAKSVDTPALKERLEECKDEKELLQGADVKKYRRIVGQLMYIANQTRPDIAYAVHSAARFMQKPGEKHAAAVMRILQYLRGTQQHGLIFGKGNKNENIINQERTNKENDKDDNTYMENIHNNNEYNIESYADADWNGDRVAGKSVTGVLTLLNGDVVDWSCKRQQSTALSTMEAEYYAVGAAVQTMKAVHHQLVELNMRREFEEKREEVEEEDELVSAAFVE